MTNPADARRGDPHNPSRTPRVFTIPADVPFLPSLARAILAGGFPAPDGEPPGPLELSQWTVLLPTRRAVRALTTAFLAAGGGRALILPRIRPLGDVDEDEFAFSPSEPDGIPFAVPPAIPETHQLFLLARLIDEWLADHASGQLARTLIGHPGQVFGLARSLIRLIDSFETEELSLDALGRLLGPDFAAHRQAMLEFLNIIRTRLPQELEAAGLTGRAERRSVLLREEARRLASGPYARPIIAAGSTGTIPATAHLLKAIAGLPQGAVVLPGLDQILDKESWQETAVEEGHPQHGINRLLHEIGIGREDVMSLPGIARERPGLPRLWLASELMRPVATSDRWKAALAASSEMLPAAFAGLEIIEAPDETREALVAALILRSALERPGLTASLITPDRRLARRVKSELRRWGIEAVELRGRAGRAATGRNLHPPHRRTGCVARIGRRARSTPQASTFYPRQKPRRGGSHNRAAGDCAVARRRTGSRARSAAEVMRPAARAFRDGRERGLSPPSADRAAQCR